MSDDTTPIHARQAVPRPIPVPLSRHVLEKGKAAKSELLRKYFNLWREEAGSGAGKNRGYILA